MNISFMLGAVGGMAFYIACLPGDLLPRACVLISSITCIVIHFLFKKDFPF